MDTTDVHVNQRNNGGQWNSLGSFALAAGVHNVKLSTDSSGVVVADAVEAVPAGQITSLAYIFPDQVNAPRIIVRSQDDQIVWDWSGADPFGATAPVENTYLGGFTYNARFPGQVWNNETQTAYNYLRDCYDPVIGRYCQSDPIGLLPGVRVKAATVLTAQQSPVPLLGQPKTLLSIYDALVDQYVPIDPRYLTSGVNTYAYVDGNPLSYVDPGGLDNPGMGPYGPNLSKPSSSPGGSQDPNPSCVVTGICVGMVVGGTLGRAPGALIGAAVGGGIAVQFCPAEDKPWPPPLRRQPPQSDVIFGR